MKVLFLAPASSTHTMKWVNSLSERGIDVVLVSLPNHQAETGTVNNTVKVQYLPHGGSKGYFLNAHALKKLYRDIKPDVVNVHYASGYGTLARNAKLPKIILSVWGSDVYEFPYLSSFNMKTIKANLEYATFLASTSNVMADQVRKLIKADDITITPFGVDLAKFSKTEKKESNVFTIGLVKTLEKVYGIETVIKAYSIFLKKIGEESSAKLMIYGEGSQREALTLLAEELGVSDSVELPGRIEHSLVPEVYSNMDVACFGSLQESFGVSAVEAMACEIPVVATNAEGYTEIIEDEKTGYIVPVGDEEKMAERLVELYKDSQLRDAMGKAGRELVEERYDWNKNVDNMIRLYESAIGK